MTAATPRPWERKGLDIIAPGRSAVIATVHPWREMHETEADAQQRAEADATLMTEAPGLFEALHRLICSVQDQGREWAELKAARAALSRAKP